MTLEEAIADLEAHLPERWHWKMKMTPDPGGHRLYSAHAGPDAKHWTRYSGYEDSAVGAITALRRELGSDNGSETPESTLPTHERHNTAGIGTGVDERA